MSEWVSALLAILGSVIISWGDFRVSGEALYGDMLALIACAMVTGYWLVGQHLRKQFSLITYTYIVYGIASLVLSVYVSLFRYSFCRIMRMTGGASFCWRLFRHYSGILFLIGR